MTKPLYRVRAATIAAVLAAGSVTALLAAGQASAAVTSGTTYTVVNVNSGKVPLREPLQRQMPGRTECLDRR